MSDDVLELDYEELHEDKEVRDATGKEKEIPERYKKTNRTPSVFSRTEGFKRKEEISGNSARKKLPIFESGRITGALKKWEVEDAERNKPFNDRYRVYDPPEEEDVFSEPDSEDGDFFLKREYKTRPKVSFPNFPVNKEDVMEDLGVTSDNLRNAIVVQGRDKLDPYTVLKAFAKYGPIQLDPLDKSSAVIQFYDKKATTKMMVEARTLTTNSARFTDHKNLYHEILIGDEVDEEPEEGELLDEDDDDGEIFDYGVSNTIYKIEYPEIRLTQHVVYVNPGKYFIPEVKWRVVVNHVPYKRILLVRFATNEDVELARQNDDSTILPKPNIDKDGMEYIWGGQKMKAGLNIMNDSGEELKWNFEHDTRFYVGKKDEENEKEWEKPNFQVGFKGAIKVRGRGAKRFLGEESDTLNSDSQTEKKKPRRKNEDSWNYDPPSEKPSKPDW